MGDGRVADARHPDGKNVPEDATRLDARDAAPEAAPEAAPSRDGGPTDAHVDASVDARQVAFCDRDAQKALTLCADFDETALLYGLAPGFEASTSHPPQSTQARDVDASVSPPASIVFATLPQLDGGPIGVTRLFSSWGPFKTASFGADIRVDVADENAGYAQLVEISMGGTPSLSLLLRLSGWYVQEAVPLSDGGIIYPRVPPFLPLTPSHWVHVDLEVTLDTADGSPGGGSWQISMQDLETSDDAGSQGALSYVGARSMTTLSIGLSSVQPKETGWTVHFDNVTFDLH
jgi:hypothetical protein